MPPPWRNRLIPSGHYDRRLWYAQNNPSPLPDTPTNTSTATPTRTPRPTRTPTRTRTQKPKPPEPPQPTDTPTVTNTPTPVDNKDPVISGGQLNPPPGYLGDGECAPKIIVTDLHVEDPAPSYGLQWVKLKYQVAFYSGLIFSNPMQIVSGGFVDGRWDAIYHGEIVFEIDTEWQEPPSGKFTIQLWAKALDAGFNDSVFHLGDYTMDGSCAQGD